MVVQAVQLVQKARQSEDEAAGHRASLQPGSTDAAVAALLASRPQRRLWDDIYTISYSRLALCSLLHVSLAALHSILCLMHALARSLDIVTRPAVLPSMSTCMVFVLWCAKHLDSTIFAYIGRHCTGRQQL